MTASDLRAIPAGTVELHDARRKRRWTVDIEAFEIASFPLTSTQIDATLARNVTSGRAPLTDVSWLDAVAVCNALSEQEGLDSAYLIEDGEVTWRTGSSGYRLPTEAEWEYACRAGSTGPHYGPLDAVAWTARDMLEQPADVGQKLPNDLGLYDTLGNVWEWCWDLLDPARYGDYRVFRGGGFADQAWSVRASTRRGGAPGMSHPDLGIRLARGAFSDPTAAQGWSARADAERGASRGPMPSGWTPLSR